jgi:hypothetical protein
MITSREACHHLLVFFLGIEDDNKPGGLSSSLGFFPQVQKMTKSQDLDLSPSLIVLLKL